jgi:hypothetical protein
MSDPNGSTGTVSLSSTFLEFCRNVRNNDPSILPEPGEPLRITHLSEKEGMELADALLENASIAHLKLKTNYYTKSSAEAMGQYVRNSKCLQRISWKGEMNGEHREMRPREDMLCCFLPAFQESTSLRELHMELPQRVVKPHTPLSFQLPYRRWCRLWRKILHCYSLISALSMVSWVSVNGPFWPWRRVYQR